MDRYKIIDPLSLSNLSQFRRIHLVAVFMLEPWLLLKKADGQIVECLQTRVFCLNWTFGGVRLQMCEHARTPNQVWLFQVLSVCFFMNSTAVCNWSKQVKVGRVCCCCFFFTCELLNWSQDWAEDVLCSGDLDQQTKWEIEHRTWCPKASKPSYESKWELDKRWHFWPKNGRI